MNDTPPAPAPAKRTGFGEYLIQKGYITQQVLHAAKAEQAITQERLGLILCRGGFISRATLLETILATNPDMIHGESLFTARIPADVLMGTRTMVVAEAAGKVYLATLESERQAAAEIKPYYPEAELVFVAADFEKVDSYLEQVRAMEQDDDSLVDKILRRAFADGVSDLHIVPRYDSYTIFSRYLGRRAHTHEGTLDEYNTLSARIKDLSRMDLAERRVPQDGGFQMEYNGKLVDLRVSAIPTGNSEYIVIRLLDPDRVQPSLDGLGVTRISEWRKGVSRPDGLCLIAGPTGSGKTSTLNASIREMDRFGSSIFTMEDPVEYRIPYVGQVNKNETLGLDFSRGIRAFMRSDPDVIVVGEIRDAETARNAIKAGETGHLVLGTLHTGSIFGVVARLRDLEVPQHELLYLLRSILVQRLIRTTCVHCKGDGCPACYHSGYGGRTVISESAYFSTEEDVKKLLAGERSWPTMLEDAILKCQQGITTRKEVIRVFGEEALMLFEKLDKGEA